MDGASEWTGCQPCPPPRVRDAALLNSIFSPSQPNTRPTRGVGTLLQGLAVLFSEGEEERSVGGAEGDVVRFEGDVGIP